MTMTKDEEITALRAENAELKAETMELKASNAELRQQVKLLQEKVDYLMRQLYGRSSEKTAKKADTPSTDGVFRRPETTGKQTEASKHKVRQKKRKSRQEKIGENFPVVKKVIHLKSHHCQCCGGELIRFGEKFLWENLEYIPATIHRNRIYLETAKCNACSHEADYDENFLITAKGSAPLITHSLASLALLLKSPTINL